MQNGVSKIRKLEAKSGVYRFPSDDKSIRLGGKIAALLKQMWWRREKGGENQEAGRAAGSFKFLERNIPAPASMILAGAVL